MANRRDVIKGGVAATAFLSAARAMAAEGEGAPAAGSGPPFRSIIPFHSIIFEQQVAAGRVFGMAAQRFGMPVHAIRGDVTDLWFRHLDPVWREQPAAVAGLTGRGALFVLERLARDKGMAVLYRGEHMAAGRGMLEHRLAGPRGLIAAAAGLDTGWAADIAALLPRCPAPEGVARLTVTTPVEDVGEEGLVSWIIAPRGETVFPRI